MPSPDTRTVVSTTFSAPPFSMRIPSLGRPERRQCSTVSELPAVMCTPMVPPAPGSGTMTRFRSPTCTPAVAIVIAGPPVATTLPTAPGTARILTDFVTVTVAVLKLAESSIQISPPGVTAASAAGNSRQGCCSVQGLASLPLTER